MLSLLGLVKEQQTALPNQEIVLKFTNATIASKDIQETLSLVESELKALGAENIQVKEYDSGLLKISYYSDTDVSSIKEQLIDNNNLELGNSSEIPHQNPFQIPVDKHDIAYQLDVHELNKSLSSGWGFDGNLASSPEIKIDRLLISKMDFIIAWIVKDSVQGESNIPYKHYQNIALALDDAQGNIPEVRAGPFKS